MHTIWQSLAWKEWHEHKWRLAALATVFFGLALAAAGTSRDVSHDVFSPVFFATILAVPPLAIFVGTGTAAGEQSRGTLAFLQALPVPLWKVALHKLVFGLLTVAIPLLAVIGTAFVWTLYLDAKGLRYETLERLLSSDVHSRGFSTGYWLVDWSLLLTSIAASFYLWTAAAGARRRDEISAGAFGLMAMVVWAIVLVLVAQFLGAVAMKLGISDDAPGWKWLSVAGTAAAPGGAVMTVLQNEPQYAWLAIPLGLAVSALLAILYAARFGRALDWESRSPQPALRKAGRFDWLRPPLSSPAMAVAWKQCRESGPVVLVGLAGVVAIAVTLLTTVLIQRGRVGGPLFAADEFVHIYTGLTLSFGMFIALVVGIGVGLSDMAPRVGAFWRSRPIHPDLWYWTKYVAGLIVLVGGLYLPLVVVFAVFHENRVWHLAEAEKMYPPYLPLLHVTLYTAALATVCFVRHAIYAAVLAIGVVYLFCLPAAILWGVEAGNTAITVSLLVALLATTVAGWLAMRYNWGWRGAS